MMADESGGSIPSLKMIVDQVLHLKLPASHHDSVEDARASLYAAAYYLVHQGQLPTLVRNTNSSSNNHGTSNNNQNNQGSDSLLVHHVPAYCTEEHIQRLFVSYTSIVPLKISPIVRTAVTNDTSISKSDTVGRSIVSFASAKHAELAFESIVGPLKPDKQGRPQKRVYLKVGGYVNVRK
jgi:hypothetical protein